MAHLHIVRQPVFYKNKSVFAYELLYTPDEANANTPEKDMDTESLYVLTAGFLSAGIDTLAGGKPAVVKFTEYLLVKGLATIFPKEQLLIELDQNIRPTPAVLDSLRSLRNSQYRLLYSFIGADEEQSELMDYADIVRVDYKSVIPEKHRKLFKSFSRRLPCQYLAYNIDSAEEFEAAGKAGYTLFQGSFFTKPTRISVSTVPVSKLNLLLLLKELVRSEPDIERIRRAIETDVGLSFDILKLVNSAYFYRSKKISSIRNALAYLGIQGIKKWVMMSALAGQEEKNNEAVELSLIRSRFMEQLGMLFVYGNKIEEYTLTGLFSLLEALTNCPFSALFERIPVPDEVYAILAEGRRDMLMGQCFRLVEVYEKGDFIEANALAVKLGFTFDHVEVMYKSSLRWLYEKRYPV